MWPLGCTPVLPFLGAEAPKLSSESASAGRLVKTQTAGPIPRGADSVVQGGTWESAFLASSQAMWMRLVQGPVFENHCPSTEGKAMKTYHQLVRFLARRTVCAPGKKFIGSSPFLLSFSLLYGSRHPSYLTFQWKQIPSNGNCDSLKNTYICL